MTEINDRPPEYAWVFGATGLSGRGVVSALNYTNLCGVAHIRQGSSSMGRFSREFPEQAKMASRCEWSKTALLDAFKKREPKLVFLCLGTTKKRARHDGQGYETVDYGLTKLVLDTLNDFRDASICYVSSQPGWFGRYFDVRRRLESAIANGPHRFMIIRPSFIVGQRWESRPGESIGAAVSDFGLKMVGTFGARSLAQKYASIDGYVLGAGMVQLALEHQWNRTIDPPEIRRAASRLLST